MNREVVAESGGHARPLTSLMLNMTEKVARTVFGEAVANEGVTVIPVASLKVMGGGGNSNKTEHDGGIGLGGRIVAAPIGYIVIKKGTAVFKPIFDLTLLTPVILVLGILFLLIRRTQPGIKPIPQQ